MIWAKGDVPTYIATDIMKRLHNGEHVITLPMCRDLNDKSIVDYLNEYHSSSQAIWKLNFLHHAFAFSSEVIKDRLGRFSDIEVEIIEISDTDKRVVISMK